MDSVVPEGAMEVSTAEDSARHDMLHDAIFPAFGNDAGTPSVESPEEMQKNDPLGTQIWKLYSRAKTQLPNAERMENLTWRMMAMNMRRAELDRNNGYACRYSLLLRYQRAFVAQLLTRIFGAGLLKTRRGAT
jgi:GATA-binding protein